MKKSTPLQCRFLCLPPRFKSNPSFSKCCHSTACDAVVFQCNLPVWMIYKQYLWMYKPMWKLITACLIMRWCKLRDFIWESEFILKCVLNAKTGKGKMKSPGNPQESSKMLKDLEHLLHEKRLRNLSLFSLRKRRMRGYLISVYTYLRGSGRQVNQSGLFSAVYNDRTKSNGLKFENRKFCAAMRNLFMTGVMELWNRLPRGGVSLHR